MDNPVLDEKARATEDGPQALNHYRVLLDDIPFRAWVAEPKEGEQVGEPKEVDLLFSGEILLRGTALQDGLYISSFDSIKLLSKPTKAVQYPISLSGPTDQLLFKPGSEGEFPEFEMRMHYPALLNVPSPCNESDATHAVKENLRGKFCWSPGSDHTSDLFKIVLEFSLFEPVLTYLGYVQKLECLPVELDAKPIPPEQDDAPGPMFLAGGLPGAPVSVVEHRLRLRFISAFSSQPLGTLGTLVTKLVAAANKVWYDTGGLKINIETLPAGGNVWSTTGAGNSTVDWAREAALPGQVGREDPNSVEVYLVDSLAGGLNNNNVFVSRKSGGVTHNCGCDEAYIILEIGKADHNRYLLAHEIGHVLGLKHPPSVDAEANTGICTRISVDGSECSVMIPDFPCSHQNTDTNLVAIAQFPLNRTMTTGGTLTRQTWPQQHFFHYVRDFPEDDGSMSSVPAAPASTWWTHSDVWNNSQQPLAGINVDLQYANRDRMFDDYNVPVHSEPYYSRTNYAYVRVHQGESMMIPPGTWPDVKAHLFLVLPGSSSQPITRLTPAPDGITLQTGRDEFKPGVPGIRHHSWSITKNPGDPTHGCLFALIISTKDTDAHDLTTVINSTQPSTFYQLFSWRASDNDVAQRNVNLQQVSGSGFAMLPFIMMSNPLNEPGEAELEVTFPEGTFLRSLQLEIDNQLGPTIEQGEKTARFRLWKELPSGTDHTLRLVGQMSRGKIGDAPVPVDTSFYVNGQLIAGYTHELRVSTTEQIAFQVMDGLYGALIAAEAGFGDAFQAAGVKDLPERVLEMVEIAEKNPCAALTRLNKTRPGLRRLSRAICKTGDTGPLVRQSMAQLARLLNDLDSGETLAGQFERIRAVSDHILEPAGREARRLRYKN